MGSDRKRRSTKGSGRGREADAKSRTASKRNAKQKKSAKKAGRGIFGAFVYWGAVLSTWLIIAAFAIVVWYAYDLPDVERLGVIQKRPSVTLLAADGARIAAFGQLYGEAVQLDELPRALSEAVLATEDRRFYSHFGVDLLGLARAVYVNLRARRIIQGGSTITQQLAKNVFLTPERTVKRKVQEFLLALWLENEFSKQQILTLYLNRVYFGAGTYGVEAAARKYFDKSARGVGLAEAAMLAGLLRAPSRLAPTRNLEAARARARVVLDNMVDAGYLEAAEAARAKAAPARARPRPAVSGARYFADWILDRVPDYIGHSDRDLVVLTTLDSRMQTAADRAVAAALTRDGARLRIGQAALVALQPNGAIRAMVGGRSYALSQFNRAVQARRQPGSAFKPVVYLAGLESGLAPDSVLEDKPISVDGWRPSNYDGRHHGRVSLRDGLARSINTIAVQVSERAGREAVIHAALRLGIASPIRPHPAIALGTAEVGLLELATAYAVFANGGAGVLPHGIAEIRSGDGTILYRRGGTGAGRVVASRPLNQMSDMLSAAIREGTGKAARLDRPAAGKTGTSQDFRDAWFVGYTRDLVAGVWLGNDDGRPMRRVTGGGPPARIWRAFMAEAHRGRPARPLATRPLEAVAGAGARTGRREDLVTRILRVLGTGGSNADEGREVGGDGDR